MNEQRKIGAEISFSYSCVGGSRASSPLSSAEVLNE
jgi:hypothetical protein